MQTLLNKLGKTVTVGFLTVALIVIVGVFLAYEVQSPGVIHLAVNRIKLNKIVADLDASLNKDSGKLCYAIAEDGTLLNTAEVAAINLKLWRLCSLRAADASLLASIVTNDRVHMGMEGYLFSSNPNATVADFAPLDHVPWTSFKKLEDGWWVVSSYEM